MIMIRECLLPSSLFQINSPGSHPFLYFLKLQCSFLDNKQRSSSTIVLGIEPFRISDHLLFGVKNDVANEFELFTVKRDYHIMERNTEFETHLFCIGIDNRIYATNYHHTEHCSVNNYIKRISYSQRYFLSSSLYIFPSISFLLFFFSFLFLPPTIHFLLLCVFFISPLAAIRPWQFPPPSEWHSWPLIYQLSNGR